MAFYQIVTLGLVDRRMDHIVDGIRLRLMDLGLDSNSISIINESNATNRDPKFPSAAIFFGYAGANGHKHEAVASLIEDSIPIITVVDDLDEVYNQLPATLHHINAAKATFAADGFDRIVSVLFEGFRLLRKERRIFISYKRRDSQAVANQLYDALDSRGFDVFIDVRSVPPGADFQAELWHRLADSDVMLLIDTENFRVSRWTVEELARANASNIQILHLLWPGQSEDELSSFSHYHRLSGDDFSGVGDSNRGLVSGTVESICREVEMLRGRAIAARHRYLVDSFCDTALDLGFAPVVQPYRWVSIELKDGKELAVVPAIGVPTSTRINQIFEDITLSAGDTVGIWVLYDSRGIITSWVKHLSWLDSYLPVKSVALKNAHAALVERQRND